MSSSDINSSPSPAAFANAYASGPSRPQPQDAPPAQVPYNNITTPYDQNDHEQQIEALEQALHIQINKRMEAERNLRSLSQRLRQMQQKAHAAGIANTKSNANVNANAHSQLALADLTDSQELLSAFMSEVDGLDGDESESTMDRKDVLWMMKELQLRMNDVIVKIGNADKNTNEEDRERAGGGGMALDDIDGLDDLEHDIDGFDTDIKIDSQASDRETLIAKLEGRVAQLSETNRCLAEKQKNGNSSMSKQNSNPQMLQKNYNTLKEKHARLEGRHGNIMKEMQQSLTQKNQEIAKLKQNVARLEQQLQVHAHQEDEGEDPSKENRTNTGSTSSMLSDVNANPKSSQSQAQAQTWVEKQTQQHQPISPPQSQLPSSSKSPLQPSPSNENAQAPSSYAFLKSTTYKDIQIKSLTEEVEERNAIIEELRLELDQYTCTTTSGGRSNEGNGNGNGTKSKKQMNHEQMLEADRVKIKYLENIIHDLEAKLRKAKAASGGNCGTDANGNVIGNSLITNGKGTRSAHDHNHHRNTTSTKPPTPRHRYGSLGYFGSYGSCGASLVALGGGSNGHDSDETSTSTARLTSTLTGVLESSMMEDMELMIAELTERLKDMEQERDEFKNELKAWKS